MGPAKQEISPWGWVDKTRPEDIQDYHILMAYRLEGPGIGVCPYKCLQNCKKNPFCLWGLGERHWIGSKSEDDNSDDGTQPEFRRDNDFVGIINLGTTCYVNSLLQLWYHNPIIRPTILKWTPSYGIDVENYKPGCALGELQAMFARMKSSKKSAVDPTPLVQLLNLNVDEQQDAQEFAKLFMSMLSSLAEDTEVSSELNRAFEGTSRYETECKVCKKSSGGEEKYTELNLCVKDVKNMSESFVELFTDEELVEDNQYNCRFCNKKSDALRRFQLLSVPPVLNIQLLRFVYDKETRRKKKVTSQYVFPETLDMAPYVKNASEFGDAESFKYMLTGYLVHNGMSASSGHYVAHIRDLNTGAWRIFNDDSVSQSASKNRESSSDDVMTKSEKTGEYKSTGAYMLVYARRSLINNPPPDPEIPLYLKNLVSSEDKEYEDKVRNDIEERQNKAKNLETKKLLIETLYNPLIPDSQLSQNPSINNNIEEDGSKSPTAEELYEAANDKSAEAKENRSTLRAPRKGRKETKRGAEQEAKDKAEAFMKSLSVNDLCFIPTSWINGWFKDTSETKKSFDTSEIKCLHGKLGIAYRNEGAKYKAIPENIFTLFDPECVGEEPKKLQGFEALCKKCVENECRFLRSKAELEEDSETFKTLQTKVTKELDQFRKGNSSSAYTAPFWQAKIWVTNHAFKNWKKWVKNRLEVEAAERDPENSGGAPALFNSEIQCVHGGLELDESARKITSIEAWSILTKYFPNNISVNVLGSRPCEICQTEKTENAKTLQERKKHAEDLKEQLCDLIKGRNRPYYDDPGTYYFITDNFFRQFMAFVKNPERNDCPKCLMNSDLICEHAKFKFPVETRENLLKLSESVQTGKAKTGSTFQNPWHLVTESEWELIANLFSTDQDIKLKVVKIENSGVQNRYDPEPCEICSQDWFKDVKANLLKYEFEPIYLRPLIDVTSDKKDSATSQQTVPEITIQDEDDEDEDFKINPSLSKRRRLDSDNTVRRSNRSRHGTKEKRILVSSDQTIQQLKIQLVKELSYKILASDITFLYDDVPLLDTSATLASLGIIPGSLLLYTTESQTNGDTEDFIELDQKRAPETGFAGTMLQLRLDDKGKPGVALPKKSPDA